ncbi:MAG: lactoylglutathione lyase [Clostridiales bacterium]|nr:lactoylglutathione lyase [Clostridiales bacterium]
MIHQNFNVLDLEKSIAFYQEALGLHEVRRNPSENFTIAFLADDTNTFQLELTWLKDRTTPYNLGDEEFHLAFRADDFDHAHDLHQRMDCICFENKAMGIYFIKDPDGYWLEILPTRD